MIEAERGIGPNEGQCCSPVRCRQLQSVTSYNYTNPFVNRLETDEARMGLIHKLHLMINQTCTNETILAYFKTHDGLEITHSLHKLRGSSKEGLLQVYLNVARHPFSIDLGSYFKRRRKRLSTPK